MGYEPPSPTDLAGSEPRSNRPPGLRNLAEWLIIGLAALLVAVLVKIFLLQAFYIPSLSMSPTLKERDRVLVNKLSYKLHDVNRGDIVVFRRSPKGGGASADLIKRVIALPGETVEARDGHVWIRNKDGERMLKEPYLAASVTTDDVPPSTIPANHYWLMGDNRSQSRDSRSFGPVPKSSIVGRAFIRFWPVSSIALL